MPINNIQSLVDKNGLNYIKDGEYLSKYYDEALANLGQRNTNDSVLNYITYNLREAYESINYNDLYGYIIYSKETGVFYTLDKDEIESQNLDIENIDDLYYIIQKCEELKDNNCNFIKQINIEISESDKSESKYVIHNYRLNIIDSLCDYIKFNDQIQNLFLWIPIEYSFGYIANGINKNIIYNNYKDIYVKVIPFDFSNENDDYELEDTSFYKTHIFYFNQQNYVNINVYQYYTDKDNKIQTELKFTLPYVDEEDYWNINNVKTNIQAKAHDAINLNIILAYYYKKNNNIYYKFLSGINNIDTEGISKEPKSFKIQDESNIINCSIDIPKIDQSNITKENVELNTILMNSTLIIIAKISDIAIQNIDIDRYGNGYVTTMWKYNQEEHNYDCICLNDDIALDFNQLTNFSNLLKYEVRNVKQTEPSNYLFPYIIFDKIEYNLKQSTDNSNYSYPVLQNLVSDNYINDYNNNLNFSLKYVNNVLGTPGKEIQGINNVSNNKYLSSNSNATTNTLYQYVKDNKITNYNEYIPNYDVPVFDMSEFLVKDINAMNKYNIISFDFNGDMYYSYIGISKDTTKDILTLGTSTVNINLGEKTLANQEIKQNFKEQNTLNINFKNININGLLNANEDINVSGTLTLDNFEWIKSTINNTQILSTMFIPQFKYYSFSGRNYIILDITDLKNEINKISGNISNSLRFGSPNAKKYLYIAIILKVKSQENNITYYYKYNDLLVLQNLVTYLNLDKITTFESNTNEIIYINNSPTYMISSNSILNSNLSIVNSTELGIGIDSSNIKTYYIGNMLYVTYIPNENKLIINEVQSNKIKSIWQLPTKITI